MYRCHLLFLIFIFLTNPQSQAQIFGGTSPRIKWEQVKTSHVRIIYPKAIDSTARKIASDITRINSSSEKTIGTKIKNINIVLRNQNLVSNGYVALSPFRSEFYLTPMQNPFVLGSLPWPDMLSVHEYRHVEQYSNFDVGLSHVFKSIFGQSGQAFANAASVPDWFFEGDAVYQETNFTKQGRGSLPYFYNGFRSLWREGKNYSWMKLRNGSYHDFIPDKYILGFMLTAYAREKFGINFWEKVTHEAASFKSLVYPFQSAFKNHSGIQFAAFRDSTFQFYKKQFKDKPHKQPMPDYYLNEEFPNYIGQGATIYLKSSVKSAPEFVIKEQGKEMKVRKADYMTENYFSYRNGKIVYASTRPNIRWGYKAYNEIQLLDVQSGIQKRITKKSRYFSPDLDETGSRIVAVHVPSAGTPSLDILETATGKKIKTLSVAGMINYSYPKIYGDTVVACVTDTLGRMALQLFDLENNSSETLIPFSYNVVAFPFLQGDTIYYSIGYVKNDELFALTLADRKIYVVQGADGAIGKYHVTLNNDSIAWSTFTSQGLRIQEVPRSNLSFKEISLQQFSRVTSSFGLFAINNINSNLIYGRADSLLPSKKYHTLSHPFNFHSIIPGADDPVYSLSLEGENMLNTIQTEISASCNRSDHSKTIGGTLAYGRWFPVLTAGIDFHIDRNFIRKDTLVYYNSIEPYAGIYIPFHLSRGRNFTSLTFGSNYVYSYTYFQKSFQKRFKNQAYSYLSNYLSFSNQSQSAAAQVLPRFAQSLFLNYKTPVSGISGFQWLSTFRLFLPGFGSTHSLNFTASYSQKDTLHQINFSNSFPFARGYQGVNSWKMAALQLNYQLPICYPDWGFANIVYFLRVRGNAFFDQTFIKSAPQTKLNFRSAGLEIYFDTKWWNQAPVSFGVRYSRLLDPDIYGQNGNNRWELILPVNLFNK